MRYGWGWSNEKGEENVSSFSDCSAGPKSASGVAQTMTKTTETLWVLDEPPSTTTTTTTSLAPRMASIPKQPAYTLWDLNDFAFQIATPTFFPSSDSEEQMISNHSTNDQLEDPLGPGRIHLSLPFLPPSFNVIASQVSRSSSLPNGKNKNKANDPSSTSKHKNRNIANDAFDTPDDNFDFTRKDYLILTLMTIWTIEGRGNGMLGNGDDIPSVPIHPLKSSVHASTHKKVCVLHFISLHVRISSR